MKIIKCLRIATLLGMTVITGSAWGYSTADDDKVCKKPKFRTFEPEHLSEVDPGSEVSFHVSNWADPNTIKAEARKIPMKVSVVDKMNFFVGTAKLPDSISGRYARISLSARSKEGRCLGQGGWLLKVRDAAASVEPVAADESQKVTDEVSP